MNEVDSRALISASARLGQRVKVGAFAVVGDDVELGDDCVLHPHAVVRGPSRMGRANIFDSFCSVGGDPQDLTFRGERTELIVGDENSFREFCTVSRGTVKGGGVTRIGSGNLFMSYSHIAHDSHRGRWYGFRQRGYIGRARHSRGFRNGGCVQSGAPILQDWPLCVRWGVDGDHAGCRAVFQSHHGTRNQLLWCEHCGSRTAWI